MYDTMCVYYVQEVITLRVT